MKNSLKITFASLAMTCLFLIGCSGAPDTKPGEKKDADSGHAHPSEGPHGGDLIELGNEEYHGELLHPKDHESSGKQKGVVVYILDGSAKKEVPIDATEITLNLSHDGKAEQFKLAAMPTETNPNGKSSRFTSSDKELLEHLHEEHLEGTLVVSIGGKSYRGELKHDHDEKEDH